MTLGECDRRTCLRIQFNKIWKKFNRMRKNFFRKDFFRKMSHYRLWLLLKLISAWSRTIFYLNSYLGVHFCLHWRVAMCTEFFRTWLYDIFMAISFLRAHTGYQKCTYSYYFVIECTKSVENLNRGVFWDAKSFSEISFDPTPHQRVPQGVRTS